MDEDSAKICAEGIFFFAKTNRLISHELKNILAIISETLGLFDELVALSAAGRKLEPKKLVAMSKSMIEEVERANEVIRCMNTFAHRVDAPAEKIDLNQILSLTLQLAAMDSVSKQVDIHFEAADSRSIYTSPFFVQNLFQQAVYFALQAAGPERQIRIQLQPDGSGLKVVISGLSPEAFTSFPTESMAMLAKAVDAEIVLDISDGRFWVVLPEKLTRGPLSDGFAIKN